MPSAFLNNETELGNDPRCILKQKGNVVWSTYKDTTAGQKFVDEDGVHMIKYRFERVQDFWMARRFDYFDSTGNAINKNDPLKYSSIVEKWNKKGHITLTKYVNYKGDLVQPKYLTWAKWKRKNITDSTYVITYYNAQNQMRKGQLGCRWYHRSFFIPIASGDTTYLAPSDKIVRIETCN